jgi:glycosyltransferase involved in cell wall biosynthesis
VRSCPSTSRSEDWRLAIIIPAHNEVQTIEQVVREVIDRVQGSVVVVDDASTDGTGDIATKAGATVLPLILQLGAWGAIRTGLLYALEHGFDMALTMDADGQHLAEFIEPVLASIRQGTADVVIGSYPERGSRARKLSWAFFRRFNMLDLEDLTSGLRAYNHAAISVLACDETSLLDYQDIGVLLHLKKKGIRITEAPVIMNARLAGHSRVFSSWWTVGRYLTLTAILSLSKRKRMKAKDTCRDKL